MLDGLSGGDITKWDLIKAMPFEMILIKRRYNNDRNEYDKKLHDIRSKAK